MKWSDYLIPVRYKTGAPDSFGETLMMYHDENDFNIPDATAVAIVGIPEDRFTNGAGEIKSPGAIRKQLYMLAAGSAGTVVDMGNLRTGKTLADTWHGLRDILSELYRRNTVTLLIGGSIDLFYGNYLAMEAQNVTFSCVAPRLKLPMRAVDTHPLNALVFGQPEKPDTRLHVCNIGYQSYYVPQPDLDYFRDRHYEAYRLGEVKEGNLRAIEPIVRDTDLLAISMDAVKYSDAPAASNASPNGFTGEEACQLAFFAGLSHRCKSLGVFDIIPQNDLQDITVKLAAQMIWYFIEGIKKRNLDNPVDHPQNFKKYLIHFDQLHHNLCFFKNIQTERWWMEVPSASDSRSSLIISCTQEDYTRATEQEIPDRWWKTYQRIN